LNSVGNGSPNICIESSFKTLEYEIAFANVSEKRDDLANNFLFKYLKATESVKMGHLETFVATLGEILLLAERQRVALLLWKLLPGKAEFAQDFSLHISANVAEAKNSFKVPQYIVSGLSHLRN
jgi:putative ATP-dependent endonuclease of OLD family